MSEHFTQKSNFTDLEFEALVTETQLGKAPTSLSKECLQTKTLSNEQILNLFERNLTKNHTIAVLNYGRSDDGINLYKNHLQAEHEKKVNPVLGTAKNIVQSAKHGVEKQKGNLRID